MYFHFGGESILNQNRSQQTSGQGIIEYGLILALIAVIGIAALSATGMNANGLIQKVPKALTASSAPPVPQPKPHR